MDKHCDNEIPFIKDVSTNIRYRTSFLLRGKERPGVMYPVQLYQKSKENVYPIARVRFLRNPNKLSIIESGFKGSYRMK